MSEFEPVSPNTKAQGLCLKQLAAAAEEHFAFWNVGIDRAWEDGSDVMLSSECFSALLTLACKAPAKDIDAFIEWAS